MVKRPIFVRIFDGQVVAEDLPPYLRKRYPEIQAWVTDKLRPTYGAVYDLYVFEVDAFHDLPDMRLVQVIAGEHLK